MNEFLLLNFTGHNQVMVVILKRSIVTEGIVDERSKF